MNFLEFKNRMFNLVCFDTISNTYYLIKEMVNAFSHSENSFRI